MTQALMFAGYNSGRLGGADFDGTNDYMNKGSSLIGAADSKSGILSAWFRIDGGNGTTRNIYVGGGQLIVILLDTANKFSFLAFNPAVSIVLNMITAAAYTAGATWIHLLSSWDLAAGATHIYINDVSDKVTTSAVNDVIDYTNGDAFIGANSGAGFRFNGCMAEYYFAQGQFLDFSITANRRKFISATGKPVILGTTGAVPTGTAPIIYQSLASGEAVANFATNRGTGGNFTITGTLDPSSTSPSD